MRPNIGSGTSEQRQVVVSHNCVPACRFISSPNLEVVEQAVWALGNIAGDCTRLRDHVLESGVLEPLFAFIEMTATQQKMVPLQTPPSLSNLVRGKNPPWDKVVCTVPLLTRLLSIDDSEVHQDVLGALVPRRRREQADRRHRARRRCPRLRPAARIGRDARGDAGDARALEHAHRVRRRHPGRARGGLPARAAAALPLVEDAAAQEVCWAISNGRRARRRSSTR